MNTPAFSVCVYCGSRNGIQPEYADVARQVGTWIGQHNGQLVYGGGNNGLMGLVAQATACLLYTSPSPRDTERSRMPSSA